MQEIMILRKNVDNKTRLKIFQVDDDSLAKLARVRGNLYRDDPRLRTVTDLPTMQQPQQPQISPERQAWLDGAYARYLAEQAATPTQAVMPNNRQPEPKPLSFEEKIQHDWRFSPNIRREFISYDSFLAYKRAEKAGRTKVYGR